MSPKIGCRCHLWSTGTTNVAVGYALANDTTRSLCFRTVRQEAAPWKITSHRPRFCRCVPGEKHICLRRNFLSGLAKGIVRRSITSTHESPKRNPDQARWPPARMMPRARRWPQNLGGIATSFWPEQEIIPAFWRRRWPSSASRGLPAPKQNKPVPPKAQSRARNPDLFGQLKHINSNRSNLISPLLYSGLG